MRTTAAAIAMALLAELDEPLMSVSLILPGEALPMSDPYEMRQILEHQVDLINLSGGGAMVRGGFNPLLWDRVDLHLGDHGTIECVVRWMRGERVPYGVEVVVRRHDRVRRDAGRDTRARRDAERGAADDTRDDGRVEQYDDDDDPGRPAVQLADGSWEVRITDDDADAACRRAE